MFADVLSRVVRGDYTSQEARLDGFQRRRVAGEIYPGLLPVSGASVIGKLIFDVTPADLLRLDEFEGPEYERQSVSIFLASGKVVGADVYVYKQELHHRLLADEWNPDQISIHGFDQRRLLQLGLKKKVIKLGRQLQEGHDAGLLSSKSEITKNY